MLIKKLLLRSKLKLHFPLRHTLIYLAIRKTIVEV